MRARSEEKARMPHQKAGEERTKRPAGRTKRADGRCVAIADMPARALLAACSVAGVCRAFRAGSGSCNATATEIATNCDGALDALRALVLDALAEVDEDVVAALHLLDEHFVELSGGRRRASVTKPLSVSPAKRDGE